ncbi:MAG: MFS transporter [Asgard group archaeon]|nr:MFS transporter [Asgard group archaeon]
MLSKSQWKLIMPLNFFHIMAHIYPYFLPILTQTIRDEIPMGYTQTAILAMVIPLVMIPSVIIFGLIGDRIRHLRFELIIIGYVLVISHTFIMYVAQSFGVLVVAAVVGGFGASVFHPITLPLLSQEFGTKRSIAHGINMLFGTIGSILTPLLAIYLSTIIGWRYTSLAFGAFGFAFLPILLALTVPALGEMHYKPSNDIFNNDPKSSKEDNKKKAKLRNKFIAAIITGPIIALIFTQVIRSGIFRILNIFTALLFEDKFGANKLNSAIIMSIVLGAGGVATLFSGFVSKRRGNLKILLYSKITTTIITVLLAIFVGIITMRGINVTTGLLAIAIILFILLAVAFYFGNSPCNSLLAELVPLEVLSTINGIQNSLMACFSSLLILFGKIIDIGYSFPYEVILIVLFALIPTILLFYIKSKIGFKTPEEAEEGRETAIMKANAGSK